MIGKNIIIALALVATLATCTQAMTHEQMEQYCGGLYQVVQKEDACAASCRYVNGSYYGKHTDSDRGVVCCCESANFMDRAYNSIFGPADYMTMERFGRRRR